MNEGLFRKKSIDRVNSPEQLNEYIRVANPSVWLVLAAVMALLVGVCAWGIFGRIDTTVTIPVAVSGSAVTGYLPADGGDGAKAGLDVLIGDVRGTVVSVPERPVRLEEDTDPYILYLGGFSQGDFCYETEISASGLSDGIYEARVVLDSVAPIRFVIR